MEKNHGKKIYRDYPNYFLTRQCHYKKIDGISQRFNGERLNE